ncbi:MAG: DNA-directed RNA polymerase subunit N [Candidatus Micrarchaeaceae archaeon]
MMIPVRCFTCGAVVADKWAEYDRRVNKGKEDAGKVLDELGVERYCCRRMFVGNVELIDEFINAGKKFA